MIPALCVIDVPATTEMVPSFVWIVPPVCRIVPAPRVAPARAEGVVPVLATVSAEIVPATVIRLAAVREMAVLVAFVWINAPAAWVMPWSIPAPLAVSVMLLFIVPMVAIWEPRVWMVPAF